MHRDLKEGAIALWILELQLIMTGSQQPQETVLYPPMSKVIYKRDMDMLKLLLGVYINLSLHEHIIC